MSHRWIRLVYQLGAISLVWLRLANAPRCFRAQPPKHLLPLQKAENPQDRCRWGWGWSSSFCSLVRPRTSVCSTESWSFLPGGQLLLSSAWDTKPPPIPATSQPRDLWVLVPHAHNPSLLGRPAPCVALASVCAQMPRWGSLQKVMLIGWETQSRIWDFQMALSF